MTAKEIYKIWAPVGKKWVDWVRPVPFVELGQGLKGYRFADFAVPPAAPFFKEYQDAAIIVDLPGAESVQEGIALAQAGFRPIPIFNGTIEQKDARATVDNQAVGIALWHGASMLQEIEIAEDARPAFLLDRNRLNRFKMEIALFDNSWDVYHQDLPSADYFIKSGIKKMIVIGKSMPDDLKKILYGFQKKKIRILLTDGYVTPKKVTIRRGLRKESE